VKIAKATALAHDRQKVTFDPQHVQPKAQQQHQKASGSKLKRRVSLGLVVNAETGEVLKSKRHSMRRHTVMNTSETVIRMKKSEARRVRFYGALGFPV
jgi:hypothetical protein